MSLNIKTAQGLQKINTVYITKQQETLTERDVNFYDYDGTLVKSYTAEEFAQLSALPSNPTHEGLTAQGWNWTLADAKDYVSKYEKLNIGQNYVTSDGKTRIYITLQEGRLSPILGLGINGSVDVDWGDGSVHDTMTGHYINTAIFQMHNYAQQGDYLITLTVTGSAKFIGSSAYNNTYSYLLIKGGDNANLQAPYLNSIRKIEIGNNIDIGDNAFDSCGSLSLITIPTGITSIDENTFRKCYALTSIIIPKGATYIDEASFYYCSSLVIISMPKEITKINQTAFASCNSLKSITLSEGITEIKFQTFSYCYSLTSITIPKEVTNIGSNSFNNCYLLKSVLMFKKVTQIGKDAFYGCHSLASIIIPTGVTSINSFPYCSGLGIIDFKRNSAPTSGSNGWLSVPTDCLIFIPYTSPTSYLTASNYPSPSYYTYLGYNIFNEGEELPTISSDENYNYTWYATLDDAKAQTNPISVGTGNKIYCRFTAA